MNFARKVWRLLVGIKDALSLCFLILFFSLLFAALSSQPNPGQVRDGALLLKLDGSIAEEPATIDPLATLLSQQLPTREYAARDLIHAIDEAAGDERITAIALDLTTFTGGPHVTMKEVSDALGRFRTAGKPISTYAVAYSDDAMMLAAQSDDIWIDPMGGIAIRGPGGSMLFYADALERFDVTAHVYQVGTYKGAGEPYTQTRMSPALRENTQAYIDQIWEEYRAYITQARAGVDFDATTTGLVDLVRQNNGDMAKASLAAGFADTIGTREEWGAHIAEMAGEDEWDDRPGAFAHTALDIWISDTAPKSESRSFGGGDPQIGVITVAGDITDGDTGPGSAGAARITRLLDNALNDDLAALVVRIDSPGGTVTGSEVIRRAVERHKAKDIPVIISMANYAASGGYWIATAGDRIFAEPETITGSIGVVLVIPSFEELLAEYGVYADQIGVTPLSGQPDLLGGLSDDTKALLQSETDAIYERFLGFVAQSRGITRDQADELAQGRVWTGGSARQLGLVDQFGGLDAAIAYAGEQAGLEEGGWSVRHLSEPADPFEAMLAGMMAGSAASHNDRLVSFSSLLTRQDQIVAARVLSDLDQLTSATGAQARCIACLPEMSPNPRMTAVQGPGWRALAAQFLGL